MRSVVKAEGSVAAFRCGDGKVEAAHGETVSDGRGEAGRLLQRAAVYSGGSVAAFRCGGVGIEAGHDETVSDGRGEAGRVH